MRGLKYLIASLMCRINRKLYFFFPFLFNQKSRLTTSENYRTSRCSQTSGDRQMEISPVEMRSNLRKTKLKNHSWESAAVINNHRSVDPSWLWAKATEIQINVTVAFTEMRRNLHIQETSHPRATFRLFLHLNL